MLKNDSTVVRWINKVKKKWIKKIQKLYLIGRIDIFEAREEKIATKNFPTFFNSTCNLESVHATVR